MSLSAAVQTNEDSEVLARLRNVCGSQGLGGLARRIADLSELVGSDMQALEKELDALPRGQAAVQRGAHHLLDLGGKRLRPMCVAIASRVGDGFSEAARQLAVASELVHAATLLHDDVVDLGDMRRGAATTRAVYGNAASIFAGDWLLIDALRRVREAGVEDTLERLLGIIEEMILAESIQLENRGHVRTSREAYFQVVEGKTAALFRWAMFAGARAGGLGDERCHALEQYGRHLGVAFQLVDDLLDYTGEVEVTGKEMFTDLREGKMTYPLIDALEQDPSLRDVLEELAATPVGPLPDRLRGRLVSAFRNTETITRCRALAAERAEQAIGQIEDFPDGRAKRALVTIAEAAVQREA
jgi:octaprenyl-diphosphate synthase